MSVHTFFIGYSDSEIHPINYIVYWPISVVIGSCIQIDIVGNDS